MWNIRERLDGMPQMDEIKRGTTLWIKRENRDKAHLNLKSLNLIWDEKDKKEVVISELKFRFEFEFKFEAFEFESRRIDLGDNNSYPLHSSYLNSSMILYDKMRGEIRWGGALAESFCFKVFDWIKCL